MRLRDPKLLAILFKLEDGEWHTFPDDGRMARRMQRFVSQELVNFHATGKAVQMIATDKGLEYIAGLQGSRKKLLGDQL